MTSPPSDTATPRGAQIVRPRWSGAILVCAKCARRHADGKAIRRALKDGAAEQLPATGRRKMKIIKTACLGLCPKNAIVAASAVSLAAGEVVLLRGERDVAAALARLLPAG